jgi:enamine deaminase RidA (YjgF/YER057c/UK114 family)
MTEPDREVVFGGKPWPARYTFVPALRVGDTLYISGTTGTDDNGTITAPGDMEEQTRQIFRKFDALLKSLGASCDDIVSTTDYVTSRQPRTTAGPRRCGASFSAIAFLLRRACSSQVCSDLRR